MVSEYINEIDRRVLEKISSGPICFCDIVLDLGLGDRIVDRSVQRLRKAGMIRSVNRRWTVV